MVYRSLYESLAGAVADDAAILRFLDSLPPGKRQPNLLFAGARYLRGDPVTLDRLRALVSEEPDGLAEVMLARRTQTNEPARCATLLPVLARLPPPLALIEVGASAGLTLLADRYSYDYAGHRIAGQDPGAPTLRCEPRGPVPLPDRVPGITWRAGLDLNPLDVTSDDDVRWLSCLVWPGEGDREPRLAAAIATARRPGAAGGLAVQRRTRCRAWDAHTPLRGRAVRARPGRPHAPGPRRRARDLAAVAHVSPPA